MHCKTQSPLAPVIEYEHYRYHNGLHEISPYRGPPTREREAAWDRLWQFGAINIPTSEMAALNGSSDAGIYKKTQQDKGEGFNAIIEGFHMLHCLNTIRQFTYLDEFEERPIGLNKSDRANREHVDHCIESLRLTLMCKPDITPFLIKVNETKENSEIADFDSFHKCVNWDKLTAWIDENKVAV
ncbi:MAG: hypothetical protein FE78DRAFT_98027 [Acidomyces sp. 'richmondensis']|nr:MAG: hypothetical protein FE78DRAFT_98027 [Acidomyces sp. 'richmondensis']